MQNEYFLTRRSNQDAEKEKEEDEKYAKKRSRYYTPLYARW